MKRADDEEEYDDMDHIASFETLDEAVAHLEKISGTRAAAMREAGRRYPGLVRKYNEAGNEALAKAAEKRRPAQSDALHKAAADFGAIIDSIQKRDGCNRSTAMRKARREHPRECLAWRVAL